MDRASLKLKDSSMLMYFSGLPDWTNNGTVEKKMARVANKSRRPPLLDITKRLSVWSLLDMLARHFLRLLKYCILSQTRISRFLERFHNMMHHLLCIRGKSPTTWATFDAQFDHILTTHCFMPHCSSSTSFLTWSWNARAHGWLNIEDFFG